MKMCCSMFLVRSTEPLKLQLSLGLTINTVYKIALSSWGYLQQYFGMFWGFVVEL